MSATQISSPAVPATAGGGITSPSSTTGANMAGVVVGGAGLTFGASSEPMPQPGDWAKAAAANPGYHTSKPR